MKFRVLISLLFIIATTFTAIHELEHISHEHNSAACQICIVDDHLVSGDINSNVNETIAHSSNKAISNSSLLFRHQKKLTNHSTAPPKIS